MELLQLKYFKALAETEHLSKTAQKLYISAPALSSAITRLERELDTTLFDRGRTITLNERGRVFLHYVNQSFDALENAKLEISDMSVLRQSRLSVGVASAVVWQGLFLAFVRKHPEISLSHSVIHLSTFRSDDLISKYNLVIAAPGDLSMESLHSQELYHDDRPMLAVYPTHRFATLKRVSLVEAVDEPFIAIPKGSSSRRYFDELFSIAGIKPKILMECDAVMRARMIMEGYGIGLVTAHTMKAGTIPDAKFVEISSPLYRRAQALHWHAKCYQSKAALTFREFAVSYYQEGFENLTYPTD